LTHKILTHIAALTVMLALLTGCNLTGALQGPAPADGTLTPTPTLPAATPATLAPTLPPAGVNTLAPPTLTPGGPTPLPPPTQIGAPTTTPAATAEGGTPAPSAPNTNVASGPGISLNPALGEAGDIVIVDGGGFEPGENVVLHWGPPDGDTGPEYWTVEADANGDFTVGLIVPPADRWPGGNPHERDLLQLRATSESLGDFYYWANFTYVERFDPVTSLTQTFDNPDWDYSIDLPDGWTWSWVEDLTDNVRFSSPYGSGNGFIRVAQTTNVNSAISAVISAEGLTASSTEQGVLGNFPGTKVTGTSGRIVWFIPARSRVYAVSIVDDAGQFYNIVASTFRVH
jgi:hypothetical protein